VITQHARQQCCVEKLGSRCCLSLSLKIARRMEMENGERNVKSILDIVDVVVQLNLN